MSIADENLKIGIDSSPCNGIKEQWLNLYLFLSFPHIAMYWLAKFSYFISLFTGAQSPATTTSNNKSPSPENTIKSSSNNRLGGGGGAGAVDFADELAAKLTLKKQKHNNSSSSSNNNNAINNNNNNNHSQVPPPVTESNLRTNRGPPPQPPVQLKVSLVGIDFWAISANGWLYFRMPMIRRRPRGNQATPVKRGNVEILGSF